MGVVDVVVIDLVKVVALHTPNVRVHHLMDDNGDVLCGLDRMRFRLLGSRPFDVTRICVPCESRKLNGAWEKRFKW